MAPQIELFANLSQQFRWKKSIFAKYIFINQATVTVDYEIVKKKYLSHPLENAILSTFTFETCENYA